MVSVPTGVALREHIRCSLRRKRYVFRLARRFFCVFSDQAMARRVPQSTRRRLKNRAGRFLCTGVSIVANVAFRTANFNGFWHRYY